MPTFQIKGSDGQWHDVEAPAGATREQIIELGNRAATERFQSAEEAQTRQQFRGGALQSILNVAEEPVRIAERATGTRLAPSFIREPAGEFRRQVESTSAGRQGELAGALGTMVAGDIGLPALAARAAQGSRLGRAAESLVERPALRAGVAGALQPVDPEARGKDYWRQKAEGTGTAVIAGKVLGGFARRADARATEAARQTAIQPPARNVDFYRFILEPIGQTHLAPQDAGAGALASLRNQIGSELNQANRQLSFARTPQTDQMLNRIRYAVGPQSSAREKEWFETLDTHVSGPLSRGALRGDDYANFITSIREQADRFGRLARRPNAVDSPDYAEMERGLRSIIDTVENNAVGPPAAKTSRDAAKQSYYRWSILSDAARPENGSVASPGQIIQVWRNREGGNAAYRQRWSPMKQQLEQWRQDLGEQIPEESEGISPALRHAARAAAYHFGGPVAAHASYPLMELANRWYGRFRAPFVAAGRVPGAVGALSGQVAPEVEDPAVAPFVK